MSWLPLYNSWMVCLGLLSFILWKLAGVGLFLLLGAYATVWLVREVVLSVDHHYKLAFWLFIGSEVSAFGGLLMTVLWSGTLEALAISDCWELPYLGCFLLIGSSFTIGAYHINMGNFEGTLALLLTIALGVGFIGMQLWEFYDCECDWLNYFYHAASFCTVGLHFSHVVVGLVGLLSLLFFGSEVLGKYYCVLVVWYWHFVDYIWLLVFAVVYAA